MKTKLYAGLLALTSLFPAEANAACSCAAVPRRSGATCGTLGGTVRSRGVSNSGADVAFHQKGHIGSGVKVAVIDSGFSGMKQAIEACELPPLVTCDCTADQNGFDHGRPVVNPLAQACFSRRETTHGSSVAEIVHDMAPGAELYLYRADTAQEFADALESAAGLNVKIVVQSRSFPGFSYSGEAAFPGGRGAINEAVQNAERQGILFVASAGNYGRTHYEGTFADGDGDGYHDFVGGLLRDESINFSVKRDASKESGYDIPAISAWLTWNAWDDSRANRNGDFKIILGRRKDSTTYSNVFESGIGYSPSDPVQRLVFTPADAVAKGFAYEGDYALAIFRTSTAPRSPAQRFRLYAGCLADTNFGAGEAIYVASASFYRTEGSLADPGYSSAALTVGNTVPIAGLSSTSSRGRSTDATKKPDLIADSQVETLSARPNSFGGTSAAAPHVAGAAALIASAFPDLASADIRNMLTRNAEWPPGQAARPNIDYGYGLLSLKSIAAPFVLEFGGPQVLESNLSNRNGSPRGGLKKSVIVSCAAGEVFKTIDATDYLSGRSARTSLKFSVSGGRATLEGDSSRIRIQCPVGEIGDLAPAEVATLKATHSSDLTATDSIGLIITTKSAQDAFLAWYSGELNDLEWLNDLPCVHPQLPNTESRDPEPGDPDLWDGPSPVSADSPNHYHPGAAFTMRSKERNGHGHQAAYDSQGMLITDANCPLVVPAGMPCVSAGSADKVSPGFSVLAHSRTDVIPFVIAAQLDGNPVDGGAVYINLSGPLMRVGENLKAYFAVRPAVPNPPGVCSAGLSSPR